MGISKKVEDRIASQLRKYQTVLAEAKNRDISESDTVVIIVDMLADVLGYKKYIDITTEHSIRGTYVDLAVKVDNDLRFLIEAKAIGVSLKENHIKQAVDYGANNGVEWVILTNGVVWQIYKVHFKQPIEHTLMFEIDMLSVNPRAAQVLECLGNLSREGFAQSSMTTLYQQRQITNKFAIGAMLLSEPMLNALKREVRRLGNGVRVEIEELRGLLQAEVLKREVFDGDGAKQATDYIKKAQRSAARAKAKAAGNDAPSADAGITPPQPSANGPPAAASSGNK